jgi:hypothetical protein
MLIVIMLSVVMLSVLGPEHMTHDCKFNGSSAATGKEFNFCIAIEYFLIFSKKM